MSLKNPRAIYRVSGLVLWPFAGPHQFGQIVRSGLWIQPADQPYEFRKEGGNGDRWMNFSNIGIPRATFDN
jgi:hypothetical protein